MTSRQGKATRIYEAQFEPRIKTYINICVIAGLAATVFGIILIPVWLIAGRAYLNKYFEGLHCELTTRALHFKKGVLFTTERTIPLDKIQDLAFKEGPVLRYFGLSSLQIETAGQSAANAVDMKLTGIIDSEGFRKKVMDQRDEVTFHHASAPVEDSKTGHSLEPLLSEISETLKRIESNQRL
ncbi:PH domain-containing protein [Rhodohalobacter sp. SW132]|uniref:PH domain-containing protein n=1 Tax=Rhodohalobacter sp. SW132 TaxID=2293433 RepID=UPI000E21C689|nr:PH domain-containing protein [Rhodohalobacter sp. SW132]REL33032.1 PH domain-containing protein [Rhodohalobacter sp. SW132]